MRALVGDIGGTKTLLARADLERGTIETGSERRYASGDYKNFETLAAEYLDDTGIAPGMACLALAGPVETENGNTIGRLTNLDWVMNAAKLQSTLGIGHVALANDFVAMGYCIPALGKDDQTLLQKGDGGRPGLRAVIGAGTGLGQALILPPECGETVIATEGGHADFAPQDAVQTELLGHLSEKYGGHVSWERILSGRGLTEIFRFLMSYCRLAPPAEIEGALTRGEDIAPLISRMASSDALSRESMALFMTIYGAQAGNLALTTLPAGGLYVTGGIAAKNLRSIQSGAFISAFNNKGRMQAVTRNIPVIVIHHPEPGLLGAAQLARRMTQSSNA